MKWTTFYGQSIPIEQMSHSHLSNILWYFELIKIFPLPEIQKEIIKRFGGIRLPYKPLISFSEEIDFLENKGYLVPEEGTQNQDIIVNNRWIGQVKYN